MTTNSTDAAWSAVRTAHPPSLSRDGCAELLHDVRRVRAWLDSVEMSMTRRLRELAAEGRSEPPGTLIAGAGGCSGKDARDVESRTDLCDDAPTLGDALAEGDLTAAHLDAIHQAARRLPDDVRAEFLSHSDDLLVRARKLGLDAFARECRELAKHLLAMSRRGLSDADELEAQRAASKVTRWVDKSTGMHHTALELDPVRDAKLNASFNAALARRRAADGNKNTLWPQLQVDAFLDAIAGIDLPVAAPTKSDSAAAGAGAPSSVPSPASGSASDHRSDDADPGTSPCACGHGSGRDGRIERIPEVTVLIDYQYLTGLVDQGTCETENGAPLPITTARRLCCDAELIPTLLGTTGEVLDQGRSTRTATRAQRRTLRSMHRGCAYPGCGVGFDACRIHHVKWWWRDTGPTDISNMIPVCEHCHHLLHEGGWGLTLEPDRTATWYRPDGTIFHQGTTIDRTTIGRTCAA